ncbi:FMN-binding negative transcriptional regulator [Sphingobium subterraneum]|uniref:Transcriptional regulator n=1 Tax=Sphingobium subterraneum TaxID=627688 RepID=A0A841J659_9SPHN|nr:FMN-binding negative transcriptional regulator [Sphingobium subterraneum]MBB6124025.1 transcriptional regulator [Sphingobium subterraneum]
MTTDGKEGGERSVTAAGASAPTPRSPFERYGDADVRRVIDHAPLAWVMASDGFTASQLPLVGVYSETGTLTDIVGHFALNNPLRAAFAVNPMATILFNGPEGYVSPSHAGNRQWGPTWNHAHVRLRVEMTVDARTTDEALALLIDHVERTMDRPWTADELGSRYEGMAQRIIGFRGRVLDCVARFKLGQDEHPDVLASILATHENAELVEWMRAFNAPTLKPKDGTDG